MEISITTLFNFYVEFFIQIWARKASVQVLLKSKAWNYIVVKKWVRWRNTVNCGISLLKKDVDS